MKYDKEHNGYILTPRQKERIINGLAEEMIKLVKKNAHRKIKRGMSKIKIYCPEDNFELSYNIKTTIEDLLKLL